MKVLLGFFVTSVGILQERMMAFGFWRSWAAKTYTFAPVSIEIRLVFMVWMCTTT